MSRSTFMVVIKSWNEIMSRTTDWATFLQDFSTASKVRFLYFTVEKVTLLNGNYQLLCYWLFSQVDVKLKQIFKGTRSDWRQFWTNKWRCNCSANFIWQKNHSGFQINFQKIHSLLLFCLCSFIPLDALANRQEVNNFVARVLSELQNRMPHTSF